MSIKKLSIITLAYNNYENIEKTVKSVFSQDIKDIDEVEFLIVDDCSDSIDYEKINYLFSLNFNNKIKCKLLINKENLGTVSSFNNAILKSSGDIIIPLSSGDYFFHNNVLNVLSQTFENKDINVVTSLRKIENNKVYPEEKMIDLFLIGNEDKLLYSLLRNGNFISGANIYYRKKFLVEYGLFDTKYRLLEDYPFLIFCLKKGFRIDFIDDITISYELGGVSTKKRKNKILINDLNTLFLDIKSLNIFNKYQLRQIKYNLVFDGYNKIKFINVIKYFDCFFVYLLNKIIRTLA